MMVKKWKLRCFGLRLRSSGLVKMILQVGVKEIKGEKADKNYEMGRNYQRVAKD